ncbi:hypothetical protein B0T17DRAFT_610700 [Bombardia bombarda]|uniref:Tip attachment protein J domain-containing protein n=1 Tax=Bombardia bombarda TaxID=252184 RepID=A0AA39TME5_9PEZI|nr:hypothetical protein B0T17DRAFT_610700 [Bombardia bombarda]
MLLLLPCVLFVLGVVAVDVPLLLIGGLVDPEEHARHLSSGVRAMEGVCCREGGCSGIRGQCEFVAGNIVDGVAIAAQVIVTEFSLETNQGYIDEISFDGTIKIRNGPNIRINDPNAVFSAGFSAPFMVADDVNPSVSSFSGFPMCVPRGANDTLCPLSNRPLIAGSTAPQRIFRAPDALVMAPFLAGDYVEYSGFRSASNEIVCFEMVAWNVQITTVGAPTYIRVEETLIGIYTADANGEVAETRFIGYTSDPAATVSIVAIDIDPCTGATTDRSVGVGQNRPEGGGRNKWIARIDGTTPSLYTREYRAVASTGNAPTRNGILAGQYAAPILDWIQPELLVPGIEPLVHQFEGLTHLTRGVGPDGDGNMFGPLDPFPQTGVAVFDVSTCPEIVPGDPQAPAPRIDASINIGGGGGGGGSVAAGSDQVFVRADDTFALAGSETNHPGNDADTLAWAWSISPGSAGTRADLQTFALSADNKTLTAKFAAGAPVGEYSFVLEIASLESGLVGSAAVKVTLFSGPDTVTVTAVTWTSGQSGTIGVVCKSNYLVDAEVGMTVTYPGDRGVATGPMAPTPPGSGSWSFSARRVDQPGTVSCQSLLGGSATRVGLTSKKMKTRRR